MEFFQKYKSTKNDDGSYNIEGVPIFVLGKHRNFEYDEKWFGNVQKNHAESKEKGFLPSVIVGHNDGKSEKESIGFLDNLKLVGKEICSDITKVSAEIFEKLKNRAYPHRSIEVSPKEAKITALALLGGTTPYHKMPIMEVFGEAKAGIERFGLEEKVSELTIAEEVEVSGILRKVRDVFDIISRRLWRVGDTKSLPDIRKEFEKITDEGKQALSNLEKEEDNKQDEKNEEEAQMSENNQNEQKFQEKFEAEKAENLKLKKKLREAEIAKFMEGLPENLAPAVKEQIGDYLAADEVVKFAEGEELTKDDAFQKIVNSLLEYAKEKKLLVEMGETAEKGEKPKVDGYEADKANEQEFAEIEKIQKERSCSFKEATAIFLENE